MSDFASLITSVHTRTLEHACRLFDGPSGLAWRLGVSLTQLLKWLNGVEHMPRPAFQEVVRLIRSR